MTRRRKEDGGRAVAAAAVVALLVVVVAASAAPSDAAFLAPHPAASTTTKATTTKATTTTTTTTTTTARFASVEEGLNAEVGVPASTQTPDLLAYSNAYRTVFTETPVTVRAPTLGSIPRDLRGTYFRSGPAMFSAGSLPPPAKTSLITPKSPPVDDGVDESRMVTHPFEGDGAVLAVTFGGATAEPAGEGDDRAPGPEPEGGACAARFRYVRTNAFTNERKKGARMYAGMDSTRSLGPSAASGLGNDYPVPLWRHHLQPGLNRKRKNTSNTRTVFWGKKLLTLWEGGLPYKLDALALSTEGRSQLGGVLKEQDPLGGGYAIHAPSDRMIMYSNKNEGGRSSALRVYEFNSKFRLVKEKGGKVEVDLPGMAMLSDVAVTENYSVFVQPPVGIDGMQMMISKEPGKTLKLEEGASATLHLIPRVGSKGKSMKSIPIPNDGAPDADLQLINAYDIDGGIVIDAVRSDGSNNSKGGGGALSWPWAQTPEQYASSSSRKSLWRYTATAEGGVTKERLSDLQASFGTINPAVSGAEHRYVYASAAAGGVSDAAAPPQGIAKFDVRTKSTEVWMPEPHQFCGEPMFAPKTDEDGKVKEGGAEDDGYVLSVLYDGRENESEMVILDAASVSGGPVARVPLGLSIPHGLHGSFAPGGECAWDASEIARRAKLADKMEGRGAMWNEVKSDFSGLGLRLDDIEEYFGDVL